MSDIAQPISPIVPHSFTVRYPKRLSMIITNVHISDIVYSDEVIHDLYSVGARQYKALWDTGATNSVITQRVVDELSLKPIGMTFVNTASHSKLKVEMYDIWVYLPSYVFLPNIIELTHKLQNHYVPKASMR
ncbi:MAG: hypothetical protein HQL02_11805, partial [Nitrospirae bacterium]|nr:hypothetical protein [Nitrospirota bacterium]